MAPGTRLTEALAADPAETAGDAGPPLIARVFSALSDGRFHSGEELALELGVSRSAVSKAATALRGLGTTVHAVRNRGYRLALVREALDATAIRAHLGRDVREHVTHIEVAWSLPSTNTWLLERPNPPSGTTEICLAEYQSAGRGRRGRTWLAPPGAALCLSLSWTFPDVPADFGALSLCLGVCTVRVLKSLGIAGVALKWPNDLQVGDRKLGGVLIELRAEVTGPACVVVGIGINVALGQQALRKIAEAGTTATDLVGAGLEAPKRNALAGALTSACVRGLRQYQREGLKPFIAEWRAADALRGHAVNVSTPNGTIQGFARGIDVHGALLLDTPEGVKRFISGDVTVRTE